MKSPLTRKIGMNICRLRTGQGWTQQEDVRRCRDAGFAEHLVKPIEIAQLIEAIRRVAATIGKA